MGLLTITDNHTGNTNLIIHRGVRCYPDCVGGKYDFSVRMNVNTSDSEQWWKNVEMTGYVIESD